MSINTDPPKPSYVVCANRQFFNEPDETYLSYQDFLGPAASRAGQWLLPDGMSIVNTDACATEYEPPKASAFVQFPEQDCPICGERGHSIEAADCKNPIVSIRSTFHGCRRCYDETFTGLARAYLYDLCRLMGVDHDWVYEGCTA